MNLLRALWAAFLFVVAVTLGAMLAAAVGVLTVEAWRSLGPLATVGLVATGIWMLAAILACADVDARKGVK